MSPSNVLFMNTFLPSYFFSSFFPQIIKHFFLSTHIYIFNPVQQYYFHTLKPQFNRQNNETLSLSMASASLIEGFGESSSPVKSLNLKKEIFAKLLEIGNEEATSDHGFMNKLEDHFSRLPNSYGLDMSVDRAEEVVMHWRILRDAKDARKGPAFNVRFLKYLRPTVNVMDDFQQSTEISLLSSNTEVEGDMLQNLRDCSIDFESCTKLEDLNLGINNADVMKDKRENVAGIAIHEVIFSTLDKPKLLSQLSSLLSNIGLNIREAHVFSTTDGYSLDVFVVDGWPEKEVHNLHKELTKAIAQCEGSWSGVSKSSAKKKMMSLEQNIGDWEIDKSFLMMGEKISSGSSGDLHHGTYMDVDVAIKVIKSEHLDDAMGIEFAQEVTILREVHHRNIVRFIGVCTKPPHFCIVTEYMPGGSLYDFLHRHKDGLELSQLLKLAIDISKGMEYLHKNNIIHRDLKTANLLMDNNHVVKVSDFGVARFQSRGVMTAETGTYRWMAPEVIDHQPYDQKADVFSFAIVLWELTTSKVPYDTMTPLQAALGVRQGMRPEFLENTSPRLVDLIRRCWDAVPAKRPSFAAITIELEELLRQTQG